MSILVQLNFIFIPSLENLCYPGTENLGKDNKIYVSIQSSWGIKLFAFINIFDYMNIINCVHINVCLYAFPSTCLKRCLKLDYSIYNGTVLWIMPVLHCKTELYFLIFNNA